MKENFKSFKFKDYISTINEIKLPDNSGLYSWYIDYSKLGKVKNKDDLNKIVEKINDLIFGEYLNGTVKSSLRKFEVEMNQINTFIDDKNEDEFTFKKISELTDRESIEVFKILKRFSLLASPLYIGVTSSLQRRYINHKNNFDTIQQMKVEGVDDEILKAKSDKTFGGRIAYKGFKWDCLIFNYLETSLDSNINSSAEFLLNRVYSPIFGKK